MHTDRSLRFALAAATLLLAAPAVHAQTPIMLGQTITSELAASDPRVSDRDQSHYKTFLYHGRRGEAVRVTMRSSAFDAYLSLGQSNGGAYEMRQMNDDGGGGTDAQINFLVPADGDYEIRANSVAEATGAFTLALEAGTPPGPVVDHPITMGQTLNGTLSERSPQKADATFYEQYSFRGRAGQTVQITQRSSDFDAYLSVGRMENGEYKSLEHNDDAGGGNDARVILTLPADGEYVIHANSLARSSGVFTLTLEPGTPPPPMAMLPIRAGQTVTGSLESSDPTASDGSYVDQYIYHGRAGERIVVTLRSSAFDTFLTVGTLAGSSFTSIQSDDDSGGGTDSRLEVTLPADGDYAVRANSLSAGSTGAYTLIVEPAGATSAAPAHKS